MEGDPSQRQPRARYGRWLLIIPFIGLLWPPFYASIQPTLGGIPFFLWYQFLFIIIGATVTVVVYSLER